MAITPVSTDMAIIAALADLPNATSGLTAAQLKAKFDAGGTALKTYINDTLIPALEATTDSSSGADQIGATAISGLTGATVQALLESVNSKVTAINPVGGYYVVTDPTYGVVGDGVADDTAEIQAALTAGAGGIVFFPADYNFKISDTLTVSDNTTIYGYGARVFDTATHRTLFSLGSGVKIFGLEIEGAGNASYNASGKAISIAGSYSSSITYKNDVLIEDCYIHDIGAYGIYVEYAKWVKVKNCKIEDIGYAGVGGLSVEHMHVSDRTNIKGVTPGTGGNAYGVFFSRITTVDSLSQYPRSLNCSVIGCTVEDIPIWEGLDTHGGENIDFIDNIIINCKKGVAIVASEGSSGSSLYAPLYCKAKGNTIEGNGTGFGIVVSGAGVTLGSPTEYAKGCSIEGNILKECGENANTITGAIQCQSTISVSVSGNILYECYSNAIHMYLNNKGFSVVGNTVTDVQDDTNTVPGGIVFRSEYNDGVIDGNSLNLVNASLNTYVSVRGIYFATNTNNLVTIGVNRNTFSTPFQNARGQNVNYGSIGLETAKRYVATGSPEGVITAGIGSTYINLSGGSATTFYVKESGSGNTGWIGK